MPPLISCQLEGGPMLQRHNPAPATTRPAMPLEDLVQRQTFLLRKLEREGYPCEVQAARRMLQRTRRLLAMRQRREAR
jgi:hypothetical protein